MTIDDIGRDAGRRIRSAAEGHELNALDRFDRTRDRRRRVQRVAAATFAFGVLAVVVATSLVIARRATTPATDAVPSGTILYGVWDEATQQAAWYTVRTDGTGRRSIGVTATCAAWTPDGEHLLITNDGAVSPTQPLRPAIVDVNGGHLRALDATRDAGLNLGCGAVSPDGARLALEGFAQRGTAQHGIYTVDASGGGHAVRLTRGPDSDPAYSPDGREIVFLRTKVGIQPSGAGALFVVPSQGGPARRITPWDASFLGQSWSPDGEWIAFEHPYGELDLVHPDGTDLHRVAIDLPRGAGVSNPTWSPDGGWLLFWIVRGDGGEIWVARPDGSDAHRILTDPHHGLASPQWRP
jgi:Tol biopolymer transport system component